MFTTNNFQVEMTIACHTCIGVKENDSQKQRYQHKRFHIFFNNFDFFSFDLLLQVRCRNVLQTKPHYRFYRVKRVLKRTVFGNSQSDCKNLL